MQIKRIFVQTQTHICLASLQFISDKVGDNLNRGKSEHQGRFVEGGSSRKSSKSVIIRISRQSWYSFVPPGHVRGLVQRKTKDSKGRERRLWQTVSREVMEPGIESFFILILDHQHQHPEQTRFKAGWPIWYEPHVSRGVKRGWIWPGVGGRQEALGFPIRSLLSQHNLTFFSEEMAVGINLCVVESVKGWSWKRDEEEGVVARAEKRQSEIWIQNTNMKYKLNVQSLKHKYKIKI